MLYVWQEQQPSKKKYPKNRESFLEDMHKKYTTCFLAFMKMHVTNPHFCKWLKMECLFGVNQPNFFIILCYQAFGRPKLTSCRFSFFNIIICSPNLCNWANKLLDKNMFYCQGRKATHPKLGRLICEFPKSSGWRTWRRTSVVLIFF